MIKFENTETFNWEGALRGMRNPLNSWDKADSEFYTDGYNSGTDCPCACPYDTPVIGMNDMALMKKLVAAGSDHRKFMRQIFVSVDITAPLYWWKEYDTYKVGTVANSCSTMHTIHKQNLTIDDFANDDITPLAFEHLEATISILNAHIESYRKSGRVDVWQSVIKLLPSSYLQKRTCTFSYENALAMYEARKNHKLSEWHEFCDHVFALPHFAEMIGGTVRSGAKTEE